MRTDTTPPEVGIDVEHANAARMYDYMLGGGHHFAVDRERVDALVAVNPHAIKAAWANRAFLGRVVTWCVEQGIDQFLDLGSGVPTVGNVHEVAHGIDPAVRVAYVDFEPVAVAHATELLAGLETVSVTRADIRDPDVVLAAPGVSGLLDLARPVALLAVTVFHFVPGDIREVLARYCQTLASGSVVAISHTSNDHDDPVVAEATRTSVLAYDRSATPVTLRSRDELRALLAGLEMVPPGLVAVTDWPEPGPVLPFAVHVGVARVP